ncbi:MAG TPA: O-antigen ligase family protein, partial [Alphaproteobacteria bacterium]|nr:O-antigen ligase family protein [Alphaproteobacteria bacterium]
LVLIKNMVFQPEILDMMLQGQRVWIPTLSLGEVNSEATFLIISATFLFGTVYFWPSLGLVAYLILLYSSRASFISLAALVLYILLVQRRRGSGISRLSKHIFLTVVMVMAAVILVLSPLGQFMLGRFGDIGYEPGTLTRFLIWEQAMDVLLHHPFGVGAQNGFALVQLSEAGTLIEDNLHSIFLQYAVDLGIHSLLFFLFAIYHTIRQMPKAMLGHPLTLALLSFGTLALSHYSGYETFFYLWLGLWLGQWHDARRNVAHD